MEDSLFTSIKKNLNDHLENYPYMLLGYSAVVVVGSGWVGFCCILPMALSGELWAILFLGILWGLPFLAALKAVPIVVKHTLSGEHYPDGAHPYGAMPILCILGFIIYACGLVYLIISFLLSS